MNNPNKNFENQKTEPECYEPLHFYVGTGRWICDNKNRDRSVVDREADAPELCEPAGRHFGYIREVDEARDKSVMVGRER